jgi:hypothetical protein
MKKASSLLLLCGAVGLLAACNSSEVSQDVGAAAQLTTSLSQAGLLGPNQAQVTTAQMLGGNISNTLSGLQARLPNVRSAAEGQQIYNSLQTVMQQIGLNATAVTPAVNPYDPYSPSSQAVDVDAVKEQISVINAYIQSQNNLLAQRQMTPQRLSQYVQQLQAANGSLASVANAGINPLPSPYAQPYPPAPYPAPIPPGGGAYGGGGSNPYGQPSPYGGGSNPYGGGANPYGGGSNPYGGGANPYGRPY